jgi:ABC-type branched-subunit amino acid transport system ATPase component
MNEGLELQKLTIAFGGNIAVDDLTLAAPVGRITGLIGPNGAGKTTTFNACSGLLRPRSGDVRLLGSNVTRQRASVRARAGLGRTFQRVEICPTMTVRDNVLVGIEANIAGTNPIRQIVPGLHGARRAQEATDEVLERCGITHLATRRADSLSTGQRRLIELARVLGGRFRLLLLDEPSSGLDDAETDAFARVVRAAVLDLGVGVLLVEHDMTLVMGTCEHIFVLDFGRLIYDGTPTQVQASPAVTAAYLGEDIANETAS